MEFGAGRSVASFSASEFRQLMEARLDLGTFEPRGSRSGWGSASLSAEAS